MRALAKLEPIQLPDLRKPTATPSLPAWLASQRDTLKTNLQLVEGSFREVLTLPANRMPSSDQMMAIADYVDNLSSCLTQTPENGGEWAAETLSTITSMMSVLGGHKASELAAEAKGDAYMVALEDVPSWAVVAASRRWYRSACGNDPRGNPYDYRFMPDPATMRRLGMVETFRVRNQIDDMRMIASAVEFKDCTAELERGRLAMKGLAQVQRTGDMTALGSLTYGQAIELGAKAEKPSGQPAAGEGAQSSDQQQDRDQRNDDPKDFDHHGRDHDADRAEHPEHQEHAKHEHA